MTPARPRLPHPTAVLFHPLWHLWGSIPQPYLQSLHWPRTTDGDMGVWGLWCTPRKRRAAEDQTRHPLGKTAGEGWALPAGWHRAGQRTLVCCVTGSVFFPSLQKLAFYSKMQEAPESGSSASVGSSFSGHAAASIKEEDCSPEKERPPEAEYISSRCVLFTYFQGDISAVVDEHFSRALSQPSSFSLGSAKAARNAGSWRGERPAARG